MAAGVGWTWGGGTMKFKGKTYQFNVKGLNVAAVGISKISAKGEAYNLKDASDLAGTYVTASAGAAVIKGKAGLVMRNDKGVVINLNVGSDRGAVEPGDRRAEDYHEIAARRRGAWLRS